MAYKIVNGKIEKIQKHCYRANSFGATRDWEQTDPTVVSSDSWRKDSKLKYRQMRKQK